MKKAFFTLSLLFLLTVQGLNAQITILSSDVAAIGDTVMRAIDTLTTYTAGPAGANQSWDFSAGIDREIVDTKVVSPSSTTNAANFTGSNLAMTNDNLNYLYFSLNTDSMVLTGLAGDLLGNGNNVSAEFNPEATINHFPMTYGNTHQDNYYFDETTSGQGFDILFGFSVDQIRLQHTGYTYDTVDAWGSVTTPYGTYDALRNKHIEVSNDVIQYKIFSFSPWATFGSFSGISESYTWTAKESGLAVAELAYDSLGNPDRLTYYREAPLADFSLAAQGLGVVNFTDLSTGKVDTWSWDFGDGSTFGTTQNPSHTYGINGTFPVCLTITNSAGTSFHCDTVTITDAVGRAEELALSNVKIYPNPAIDQVWVESAEGQLAESVSWKILDLQGKLLAVGELNPSGSSRRTLRLPALGAGNYILELHWLENGTKLSHKLFIKD